MLLGHNLPPHFKDFLNFYQTLQQRSGNKIPAKDSLKMAEMARFLPYYFLLERKDIDTLIVKIVGTSIDETLGQNFTNDNLFDKYKGDKRSFVTQFWECLFKTPCGGLFSRKIRVGTNEFFINSIQFPISNAEGAIKYSCGIVNISSPHRNLPKVKPGDFFGDGTISQIEYLDIGKGLPLSPPSIKLFQN